MNKILLLEDDILFGESLQDLLEDESYEVVLCRNGQEALDATYNSKFNLYLLDINVPLIDGISLLKDLRHSNDRTPAIFLTSHVQKEVMVNGFISGADDYMKKPFDTDELLLRMHALLLRANSIQNESYGSLRIDKQQKRIFKDDCELDLSVKEYTLLALMIRQNGKVVTKEVIINELWHACESVSDGAIRVYINRLKGELGSEAIENIRGVGYRLVS
ncbi:MAG: response regulator transcription factor [Campylobacterota bacterium]|nr:response regulator transcription factor [Campylobacterota bacterium]